MNMIMSKAWVCQISEEALQALGRSTAPLWRQITIAATKDRIKLSLMDVDREAASGGYWSTGYNCVDHTLTWDDLQDQEFLNKMLSFEIVVVFQKAKAMLAALAERMPVLREALQNL